MSDKSYEIRREIGIKILEQIGEWTDDYGLETSMSMEMELVRRVEAILEEKGFIEKRGNQNG